ncbi:MAG: filamentous hemagglutinin N-terminal domain-containing protein, partial [Pseudomonadota bacterium]
MKGDEFEIARPSRLLGCAALLSGISHRALAAALIGLMAGFPVRAQQLPSGGTVTAGSATITTPNTTTLNVNQSTNQAIINWQSFSIGQGYTVNFNQPGASSSTLNRVTGPTASLIAGMMNAPGTVLLVNPNGIAITKTGIINVGSFAASTLDIKDSDYLAGRYKFTGNGGSAGVTNAGRINVSDGGFAALLGGQVSNSGTITARLGKVGLGAGELITLDFAGDGFLSVAVPSSQLGNLVDPNGALVTNSGKIRANGGTVMLSAATAANVLRDAVNVPGSIRANSVGTHNGKIVIGGGAGGKVNVSGKLAAKSKTGKGGDIAVTGKDIKLAGAQIDASGKTGGGNINIGGGRQGEGPLQRAETLTVDAATTIKADAKDIGKGGNVVLWSDVQTTFEGNISARGGANGGNGGEAEVSGKQRLSYGGSVDLRAVNGQTGTLLLDPTDFKIAAAGGDATGASIAATLATANVAINSNSGATGTNGDILVNDTITWTSANSLTLNAVRSIAVNAAITGTNGALNLNAGQGNAAGTITQTAAISVNTLTLSSSGGNATLSSFDNSITNLGTTSLGTGALSLSNNKSLTVSGAVSA